MAASLGPITARFAGVAIVAYDADFAGRISGEGRDRASGTTLSGQASFRLHEVGAGTAIELAMSYALRGKLAQFGRGPVVRAFAAEIAQTVARNLDTRLSGDATAATTPARLGLGLLLWRALRRFLSDLLRSR